MPRRHESVPLRGVPRIPSPTRVYGPITRLLDDVKRLWAAWCRGRARGEGVRGGEKGGVGQEQR